MNFVTLHAEIQIQTILMLTLNCLLLCLVVIMVHSNVVLEATVFMNVKSGDVQVDVGKQFTNKGSTL